MTLAYHVGLQCVNRVLMCVTSRDYVGDSRRYCVPAESTGLEPATPYRGTAVPKRPLTIRLLSVVMTGLEPVAS